ncbi:MAG: type II/IV secretion system protein [Candidatus Pacebacteria bacterium]|nr:type II/IV secretion system protein [Candidatus Paceibacterota bacterium]PIR60062.1 MAG: type II secretion system protein GspE [Candidatus Pacebacteria bacterium CG10_big_fil_rev_8_21_14_0_10_44_54]
MQQSAPTPAPAKNFNNILDVLVSKGQLTAELANVLQVENISTGKSFEELIVEKNIIDEQSFAQAKAIFHNVPYINLNEVGVAPEAISLLPEGSARHYKMLPFIYEKESGLLKVAMIDPLDLSAIDFAQQKTGLRVEAYYTPPSVLEQKLAEYYSQTLTGEVTAALEQTTQVAEDLAEKQNFSELSGKTIKQAPITKIVETVLAFAMKARASDVHIEPQEDRTRIRYRIDGILSEKLILPRSVHDAVVSRIKILSKLKIDEKRVPQDGRFGFAQQGQQIDLRVSTLPTIHGEKIVMRLLKKDQAVPPLPDLGLTGFALRNMQDAIKVPHGIVLITGPTGSGKTTTLYSVLHTINTPKVNIMTLEDPVEYQMPGINQVQINPQAGLTFASGLRSFLRQDPNVIMVGEIRDSETAELAIQASLTGHLVFSTLHTSSAAGALPRLLDMGAEPFLLASSMTLVAGQRVARVLNPDFKEAYTPEPEVVADIKQVLGVQYEQFCKEKNLDPANLKLYRSRADRPENQLEYKGRVAIFEVIRITEAISKLILQRAPASDVEKVAKSQGSLVMKQDGYLKALEGLTTLEEVLRVAEI